MSSPTPERTMWGDRAIPVPLRLTWDKGFSRAQRIRAFRMEKPLPRAPLPCLNLKPNPKPSSCHSWRPGQGAGRARIYLQTGSCGLSERPGASLLRGMVPPRLGRQASLLKAQDRSLKPGPRPPAWPRTHFPLRGLRSNRVCHWLCFPAGQSGPRILPARRSWQPAGLVQIPSGAETVLLLARGDVDL